MKSTRLLLIFLLVANMAGAQNLPGERAEWHYLEMNSVAPMQMGAYSSVAGSVASPPVLRAPGGPGGPGTPNPFNPSQPPVRQDPIGDGLIPLLLFAAGYAIKRRH